MAFSLSSLHDLKLRYVLRSPVEVALDCGQSLGACSYGVFSPGTITHIRARGISAGDVA
jgi:hypothetical protein